MTLILIINQRWFIYGLLSISGFINSTFKGLFNDFSPYISCLAVLHAGLSSLLLTKCKLIVSLD